MEVEARGNDILEGFESQVRNSLGNLAERRAVLSPASQFLVFKELRGEAINGHSTMAAR